MSMVTDIMSKIFHPSQSQATPSPMATPMTPEMAPMTPMAPAAEAQEVDVDSVLSGLAKNHSEKLNWQTSIVDLLKLLDMDSSLTARKQLAKELQYTGDTNDSASMNIWLQQQVLQKLAENGGKVPPSLLHS